MLKVAASGRVRSTATIDLVSSGFFYLIFEAGSQIQSPHWPRTCDSCGLSPECWDHRHVPLYLTYFPCNNN